MRTAAAQDFPALGARADGADGIEASVEQLCQRFERLPVAEIIAGGQGLLSTIEQRLEAGGASPAERRRLLVASGWVWALLGCAQFDAGRRDQADSCRLAVRDVAAETGHHELGAWAWEMLARFALADLRFGLVLTAAEAGQTVSRDGSAAAWLALHEAKAAARLGRRPVAESALDRARQTAARLRHDADHCFVIDQLRVTAEAATVLLWLGDDEAAEDHAWQALAGSLGQDAQARHPGRVAEVRVTLGVIAVRRGDPEQAVYHGMTALAAERVCAPTLLAHVADLHTALCTAGLADTHATQAYRAAVSNWARRHRLDTPREPHATVGR